MLIRVVLITVTKRKLIFTLNQFHRHLEADPEIFLEANHRNSKYLASSATGIARSKNK